MTPLAAALLAALTALPAAYGERETPDAQAARYEMIAEVIAAEAPDEPDLAWVLLGIGWWESRYAYHVHAGHCRRGECDESTLRDGTRYHRARGPWQVHLTGLVRAGEWRAMLGASREATEVQVRVAARGLRAGYARCKSWRGSISSYATGGGCAWPRAALRWRQIQRMRR